MKKFLFFLMSVALLVGCDSSETVNNITTNNENLPSTEIFVQGQHLLPNDLQTRAGLAWPYHNESEDWETARFSIRADGTLPGYIDQSSALYYGRSPGKEGQNRGRVYRLYPYGHYNDRDLDYYQRDKKTGSNIGLFRYVYDPTGMKTQLPLLEVPSVLNILADEKTDIENGTSRASLDAVNALMEKGEEYLNSHVLWYVVKEVGMRYGWHVNGIITDYEVPRYEFSADHVPDNVEVDIHQQEHTDWNEIKTSIHIRTDCESVSINIPLKYEDIVEQDDFAIRVFDFDYSEYTITHTITHNENGITIAITNIPAELIAKLKQNFGDGLTVEIHSYCTKSDFWEELAKSTVLKTGKPCTVNGQISSAFHDEVLPIYIKQP